jgi:hypothetical protein
MTKLDHEKWRLRGQKVTEGLNQNPPLTHAKIAGEWPDLFPKVGIVANTISKFPELRRLSSHPRGGLT